VVSGGELSRRRSPPVDGGGKLLSNDIICRYGSGVVERPIGSDGGDARAQFIISNRWRSQLYA